MQHRDATDSGESVIIRCRVPWTFSARSCAAAVVSPRPLSLRGEQIYRCSCWGRICIQARSPVLSLVQLNYFLHLPGRNNFRQLLVFPSGHSEIISRGVRSSCGDRPGPSSSPSPVRSPWCSYTWAWTAASCSTPVLFSLNGIFSGGLAGDLTRQSGFRMSGCYMLSPRFTSFRVAASGAPSFLHPCAFSRLVPTRGSFGRGRMSEGAELVPVGQEFCSIEREQDLEFSS